MTLDLLELRVGSFSLLKECTRCPGIILKFNSKAHGKKAALSEANNQRYLDLLGTRTLLKKVPRYHYFLINEKESPLKTDDSF